MSEHSPYLPERKLSGGNNRTLLIAGLVVLALAVWGVYSRVSARNALAKETADSAVPTVQTVKPQTSAKGEDLVLPGTVQAYSEASIYARTSGYVKSWYTDIGTQVKKGQLLAELDTPEVDQQLGQAQADLATAQANYELAHSTDVRWQSLLATDSVSKQEADEKAGDAAAKKAALQSAGANVARLHDLESFKRVLAPFDGTVTARNADVGQLVNAGQGGVEMFHVADTAKLRIYALVPQPYANATTPGLSAELRFTERPGKSWTAQIVRTASALNPVTRTLQVELQVDNSKGELFPGAYAEVHFKLSTNADSLRLPANTVLFRSAGLQVATVGADNKISLKNIVQGRDFGSSIEVLDGLKADDNVVLNPPDSITDGVQVRMAPPEVPKQTAQPPKEMDKAGGSSSGKAP